VRTACRCTIFRATNTSRYSSRLKLRIAIEERMTSAWFLLVVSLVLAVSSMALAQTTIEVPKKPAKKAPAKKTAAAQPATSTANAAATTPTTASSKAAEAIPTTTTRPATSATLANSALPTTTSGTAAPATGAGGAAGGTLTSANVVFSPGNCVHNGNKAVCTIHLREPGERQQHEREPAGAGPVCR
jgi:hypothetical protein